MQQQRIHLAKVPSPGEVEAVEDVAAALDLRNETLADGLAELLSRFVGLTERAATAEARADREYEGRLAAAGRARSASHDLDFERAERQRLMIDNAELSREVEVRREQLSQLTNEVQWFRQRGEQMSFGDYLLAPYRGPSPRP